MKPHAEAKVRARLMALKAALERDREPEDDSASNRNRLGAMQHQTRPAGDAVRRIEDIKRVDIALARLAEGKYGYCSSCGTEIEDKRLEADPSTILCAKCGGDQQQQ